MQIPSFLSDRVGQARFIDIAGALSRQQDRCVCPRWPQPPRLLLFLGRCALVLPRSRSTLCPSCSLRGARAKKKRIYPEFTRGCLVSSIFWHEVTAGLHQGGGIRRQMIDCTNWHIGSGPVLMVSPNSIKTYRSNRIAYHREALSSPLESWHNHHGGGPIEGIRNYSQGIG